MINYYSDLPQSDFDRDLTLEDYLTGIDRDSLIESLLIITSSNVAITSRDEKLSLGKLSFIEPTKIPLAPELEPVGYLIVESNITTEQAGALKRIVEIILKSSARYLMASDLHLSTIQSDYENLQEKHRKLVESELKFKELSENLELMVKKQVKIIEAAQIQLYQSEKLASVGQLAAGIAHEINNPIGFIKSNLITSKRYVDDLSSFLGNINSKVQDEAFRQQWMDYDIDFILEDFIELLQESIQGAERVAKIVSDLKQFSNVDHSHEEITDLNEQIKSAYNIATLTSENTSNLSLNLNTLPPIKCQAGQLSQVMLNLIINAQHAISENGEITISSVFNDPNIIITITDNGHGISKQNLSRIFDPFFTTRDVGHGTGLGLTVSRDIIAQHNGSLDINSIEGKGTTVTIKIPINQA